MIFNEERILGGLVDWINDRNAELKKAEETWDYKIKEQFGPGTHGEHEAVDRSYIFAHQWEDFVESHPATLLTPEAYRWAALATYCMIKTYEKLGREPDTHADQLIADIKKNFNTKGAETCRSNPTSEA